MYGLAALPALQKNPSHSVTFIVEFFNPLILSQRPAHAGTANVNTVRLKPGLRR